MMIMVTEHKPVRVDFDSLVRIFTVPEGETSTLTQIERRLSNNLDQFLNEHIVAHEKPLVDIEKHFASTQIPEQAQLVSDHTQHLLDNLVAHSVHTASPRFIGHMTSALPYFLMPLSKIMIALNQNTVKIETSKAFTPLERQVIGMLHRLAYQCDEHFYPPYLHSAKHSLGVFCSGGTVANLTALWVARNNAFPADGQQFQGIERDGAVAALRHYGYQDMAILVSERGHYSLTKAADILGIGQRNLIKIRTDQQNKLSLKDLEHTLADCQARNIKVLAVVGIAGTTETGTVDPLDDIATLCQQYQCHFHVDAAWGGATLMSNQYRHLLSGIEKADSITIDAHKQLYIPMGAGMVLFKTPELAQSIEHHAQYILRDGSKDLGAHTLEGSRSGIAMLLYAAMHIISRPGYELLINQSIEKARHFAEMIEAHADFELTSPPELCLLTYRYMPQALQQAMRYANDEQQAELNQGLNQLTKQLQKTQRENGNSFVSRTQLNLERYQGQDIVVFRVVLANPLTTQAILQAILEEQVTTANRCRELLDPLLEQAQAITDSHAKL